VFVAGMVGMSFAAVPLYALFCQVTGFGGTTQRAEEAPDATLDRDDHVRFDANVGNHLGWSFRPERSGAVKLGEIGEVATSPKTARAWPPPARRRSTSRRARPGSISTRSPASASPSRRWKPANASRCR
jgi:cytochrome c oxidase assembly protein subunit 11